MSRKTKTGEGQARLFTSSFEEDFFSRTLGELVRVPDIALSELVANAWDAGAARVDVTIPEHVGDLLCVADDGSGLTKEQFQQRWMRLAYNRQRHQGEDVEFPPERQGWRRRAYGRNGQGRHGLLCFGKSYRVKTWRDGTGATFEVHQSSGAEPFESRMLEKFEREGHGTNLTVTVQQRLPDPDRIREVLASKFLHDPNFSVVVNGISLPLVELPGFEEKKTLTIERADGSAVRVEVFVIQGEAGRAKHQSGVAFWVGGRLVGEPGWAVAGTPIVDGRTRAGRRLTFLVKSDDLFDEVLPDWTDFKRTSLVAAVREQIVDYVKETLRRIYAQRIQETTDEALKEHATDLATLEAGERLEVADVTEAIARRNPLVAPEVLSVAVAGMIESKQKAAPHALIQRIMNLPEEDLEGLSKLLDEWTVRDAVTVLDEVGRRIKVVEALEKLMSDKDVDELHVLHPLVTQARWLFGPEYESPHYSSNVGLRNAVLKVFGKNAPKDAFQNPKKRPDLLVGPDSSFSAVATEEFDPESGVATFRRVLLVELKKGGFTIGRQEMDQAGGYIEDLHESGLLDGRPFIHAFVVGHEINPKTTSVRRIGEPENGRVEALTFGQMVRMANARLFRIRERVQDRYPESGAHLAGQLLADPVQMDLLGLTHRPPRAASSPPAGASTGESTGPGEPAGGAGA